MNTPEKAAVRLLGVATVIVASILLSGCGAIGNVVDKVTGADPLEDSTAFDINVGDCFAEPTADAEGYINAVAIGDCAVPHDNEAYASVIMEDATFPGDDATLNQAEESCKLRFFDFVGGTSNTAGMLNYAYFYPSQGSWDAGDREILCYAYDEAGQTTGSLKGANG